jgi:hypothetical protein
MSRPRPDPFETAEVGTLFTPRLREMAHVTDPHTSVAAAAAVVASGTLGAHQRLALELVRAHPGSTCPELAVHADVPLYRARRGDEAVRQLVGRRLNELMSAGLIRRDGKRDGCALWWPEEGR